MPDRYESARRAREDIWDEASIQVELEAVAYARGLVYAINALRRLLPWPFNYLTLIVARE